MKLKDKYTGEYFEHKLVMLSTMNIEFKKKGFETQIENYINFEGEEEMKILQREIDLIVESKDLMIIFGINTSEKPNFSGEQDAQITH